MIATKPPPCPVPRLRAYAVRTKGYYEHGIETIVYAFTAGQAKALHFREIADLGIPFIHVSARVAGDAAAEPQGFRDCATYRGFPWVKIGQRVHVSRYWGHIVGHNSSANWNVLVDGRNLVLNRHPRSEIAYYDAEGNLIVAYGLNGNPLIAPAEGGEA